MNILIVSATDLEVVDIKKEFESVFPTPSEHQYCFSTLGIGIAASTFTLTKELLTTPVDFIIQIGIAGSFSQKLPIGTTVWVTNDQFSDLGAITDDGFKSLKSLNLQDSDFEVSFLPQLIKSIPLPNNLKKVRGITSDTIHNNSFRIEELQLSINPDIETMEGAAIMHVCNSLNIPNIQVRSISNFVAPRETNEWNLEIALDSLKTWLFEYINRLET
ncbi:MAG: futalosine hydrolase [Bacteroidota bacterium]